MNPEPCTVCRYAREVLLTTRHFSIAMRHMRHVMRRCRACPQASRCPVIHQFNRDFQMALARVAKEWGLESTAPGADR